EARHRARCRWLHDQLLLSPQLSVRALPGGLSQLPGRTLHARAAPSLRDRRPEDASLHGDRRLARPEDIDAIAPRDAAVLADCDQAGLRRGLRAVRPVAEAGPAPRAVEPPGRLQPDRRG